MTPINKEELTALVERLIPLYPDKVEEATAILLEEYELPLQVSAMIMALVKMKAEIRNFYGWPHLEATRLFFGIN